LEHLVTETPQPSAALDRCPACGSPHDPAASFCEACGADLDGDPAAAADPSGGPVLAPATPQTAPAGEESPLDVGWTGPVATGSGPAEAAEAAERCASCGEGVYVDGYCDHCGSPAPDPRDHFVEAPASWVGGVCDIGQRHTRNEDAMALSAGEAPGSRAVLVVCDGVSMATDSHIASLAAAHAARDVLDQPLPRGAGTAQAWEAGAARALTRAVAEANAAVRASVTTDSPNPPSCTLAAAIVEDHVVVAGNVGDSRTYWLPDAPEGQAQQLGRDDSFAQEQMLRGMGRAEAESGPYAHSITRWLGRDAPHDLTPHLVTVEVRSPGWLLVCSDGLWNYWSEAEEVRGLLHAALERVGDSPVKVAQALVDAANERGGRDNITVALARVAGRGSMESTGTGASALPQEGDPTNG
jgi:serine/threonine protein phosphatase PrpC